MLQGKRDKRENQADFILNFCVISIFLKKLTDPNINNILFFKLRHNLFNTKEYKS